jgi:hypothetical protein
LALSKSKGESFKKCYLLINLCDLSIIGGLVFLDQ